MGKNLHRAILRAIIYNRLLVNTAYFGPPFLADREDVGSNLLARRLFQCLSRSFFDSLYPVTSYSGGFRQVSRMKLLDGEGRGRSVRHGSVFRGSFVRRESCAAGFGATNWLLSWTRLRVALLLKINRDRAEGIISNFVWSLQVLDMYLRMLDCGFGEFGF